MDSNGISSKKPGKENLKTNKLGKIVTDGTYYLSCQMTMAKIKEFETQKVFFKDIK